MRLIEYKDMKFYVSNPEAENTMCTFTKEDGTEVTITGLYLWDPDLHKSQGFTTLRSVLKWWVQNRDLIKESMYEEAWDNLFYQVYRYFDYINDSSLKTGSYDSCKLQLSGSLLRDALTLNVAPNYSQSGNFLLCTQSQPQDDTPTYTMQMHYFGIVELRGAEDSAPRYNINTKWTKLYNYSFKMDTTGFDWFRSVSGENSVYFGLELEISTKLSLPEIQYIVTQVEPKQEPFFIFKQDGSVTGAYTNKIELVTVPCTPRYLRKNWKLFFQKLERLVAAKGSTIDQYFDTSTTLTNGLHIHVSKDSFVDKSHSNKFLTAWHQWDDDSVGIISDVSCRPNGYKDHGYCKIYDVYRQTNPKDSRTHGIAKFERAKAQRSLAKRLKGIKVAERGTVAHDGNSATIEVRVYQGIFDIGHIIRSISFTEAMFEYCQNIGYSGFDANFARTFTGFIKKHSKFAAIHNIFKYGKGEQTQCA